MVWSQERERERDEELQVWADQGTSCPKRKVGQQHSRDEMKDVTEEQGRAGYSSRKGTAGPMLTSWSFQESPLSKSVLSNHLLSGRKNAAWSKHMLDLFIPRSFLIGKQRKAKQCLQLQSVLPSITTA